MGITADHGPQKRKPDGHDQHSAHHAVAAEQTSPGTVGRRHRVLATLLRRRMDVRIAAGADLATSRLFAARAAQLTSSRGRTRTAQAIAGLLAPVPSNYRTAAIPADAVTLATAGPEMRTLVGILRGPAPVYARGVAQCRLLVADGAGPLYRPADARAARSAARTARMMLAGHL